MTKVSVVITTYKRNHLLGEAVESVLTQTYRDIELIVVDDNPEDSSTDAILARFGRDRFIHIKNTINMGGAASLNIGLERASGDYVAILDDDDAWTSPDKLARQAAFLDAHPDYVAVGTACVVVDEGGHVIAFDKRRLAVGGRRSWLYFKSPFAHSSVMYRRREALDVGGYDLALPRGKDLDMYLKLIRRGQLGFLEDCWIKYREIDPAERAFVANRLTDARWELRVLWKHKDFWDWYYLAGLGRVLVRYAAFSILRAFPSFYDYYRKLRHLRAKDGRVGMP
jgi:glycosyltransferase involved in cell wall biosynthesis